MIKTTLLCFFATLFISPAFAQVHKWVDATGQTYYGDTPTDADTAKVKTPKQTADQIEFGNNLGNKLRVQNALNSNLPPPSPVYFGVVRQIRAAKATQGSIPIVGTTATDHQVVILK